MDGNTMLFGQDTKENSQNMVISILDGDNHIKDFDLKSYHKKKVTFGRNKGNDIIISSSIISNFHGYFLVEKNKCTIVDDNSTNGLFINKNRISTHLLVDGDNIRIDDIENPMVKGVSIIFSTAQIENDWKEFCLSGKNEVTIGRDDSCDISLKHISISKIHAKIKLEGNHYYIYDNQSTNGISVNGTIVNKKARLYEKDMIIITNSKLIFREQGIIYQSVNSGISVDAIDIVKTVKTKNGNLNISNHISLEIKPCEFVAIIGGSGAGKTTFMNCISGYNRATSGEVYVNGENLYQNYEVLKSIIGYVPQQDIVYDNLTLRSMLDYTAQLRMPKDTTEQERINRVQEVIDSVELTGREETFIRELSGGQKKRASIAVELLSDPKLFFLDEPSSGLDPGTERNLMKMLQGMAHEGKTIILVTHNTSNLHLCDKVIFLGKGGNLCFYGSPEETLKFFDVEDYVDIYNMVTEDSEKWKKQYENSESVSEPKKENSNNIVSKRTKNKQAIFKQIGILSKRYFHLMVNDKQRMILILAQAPLLAALIWMVADGKQFEEYEITKSILFALSCCAFWIGILNSIQEICKERVILKREHLTGLRLTAYISSKFIVLGFLCLVQSFLLIGVFTLLAGQPEYGNSIITFFKMYATTFLTALSATALGLFVSSFFKNTDRAMTVAPILLMPQILFSGLAFELTGITEKISYVVQCRWAMEAYGTIGNLNDLTLRMQEEFPMLEHEAEDFFEYTTSHLTEAWMILLAFTVGLGILCGVALRNVDK